MSSSAVVAPLFGSRVTARMTNSSTSSSAAAVGGGGVWAHNPRRGGSGSGRTLSFGRSPSVGASIMSRNLQPTTTTTTTTTTAAAHGRGACGARQQLRRRMNTSGGDVSGAVRMTGARVAAGAGEGRRRGAAVVVTRAAGGGGGGDGKDSKKGSPVNTKGMNPKRIASPQFSSEAQTWALLGGIATSLTLIVTLFVMANDDMVGSRGDGGRRTLSLSCLHDAKHPIDPLSHKVITLITTLHHRRVTLSCPPLECIACFMYSHRRTHDIQWNGT